MFDISRASLEDRDSVLQALLRAWLDRPVIEHSPLVVAEVVGPPHAPAHTSTSQPASPSESGLDPVHGSESESGSESGSESDSESGSGPASSTPLSRLLEEGAACLTRAAAAARERDRAAAAQARELAAFARLRPAAHLDRPADEIGAAAAATRAARPEILTEISEWAVDEVMAAFAVTSTAATRMLVEAVTLAEQLPASLAAAETGDLPWTHARVLAEVLPRLIDPVKRAAAERRLLAGAAGRTAAQLRVAARREVLRADPEGASRRAAAALRERAVRLFAGDDGLATLATTVSEPVAAAIYARIEALAAAAATPGDVRTKAQRMADCLVDLLLGRGNQPPVQVQLTLVTSVDTLRGGDEPGEVDGQPVPAVMVRELAYTLGLLPRPTTGPHAHPNPDDEAAGLVAGEVVTHPSDNTLAGRATDADALADRAADAAAATRRTAGAVGAVSAGTPADEWSVYDQLAADVAGLLGVRQSADSPLAGLPQIAVIDELSGQLLALTDAGELRRTADCGRARCRRRGRCPHPPRGPGLGPPPETAGYRPSAPLDRFVRARDRRCRFPGCRARPMRCDLDHNLPWPAGPTSHDNLCCLCRHHHRLAHQAPGWRLRRLPDGGLAWTTPGGQTLITHPPRYGTDDPPPVEKQPATAIRPLTSAERVLGRTARPGDDPAPF